MRKSKEQLEAELIIATMLRGKNALECLQFAKAMRQKREFAIAQRVTLAIMLCTLYDFYEDFTDEMMVDLYKQYLEYHKSFDAGNEDILKQMNEIDRMLGGELLQEEFFNVIKEKEEDG